MDAGWEELERMAQAVSAADTQIAWNYPTDETIERWRRLFGYSRREARRLIGDQRGDVTRERISDDHWDLIKKEKQALGYDREAYEHSLQLPKVFKGQSASIPVPGADGRLMFLSRLGGRLDSAETVKEVAGLDQLPEVREGVNDVGAVKFCVVDQEVQQKLEQWLTQQAVLQERVDIAQAWMSQAVALAPRIEPGQVELNATLGPCTCVLYAYGRVLTQPIITRYMENYPLCHKFASIREEMQTSVLLVQL